LALVAIAIVYEQSIAVLVIQCVGGCWQAVSCTLRNLPPDDADWSRRAADWLMDQINCVIKVLSPHPLTVDLLTADGSENLVDKMADIIDIWDRLIIVLFYVICVI